MRSFPSEERSKPAPEWNHYRVEAKDGVLRLSVNGKEVSGGEKCVWRKGYLALESEGAPVEWRNLRLRELPPSGAKPEETAPEAQGHRALYNGVDLRGWKTESPGRWRADDWQLQLAVGDRAAEALVTDGEFGDCEIIVDFRTPKESQAKPRMSVRGVEFDLAATEGRWERRTITFREGKGTISGGPSVETIDLSRAAARGPISLIDRSGAETRFANIYVRGL
jgi:hypothetical protein